MASQRHTGPFLAIAIALGVFATSCGGDSNSGDSVAVLGDSITSLDQPGLEEQFSDEYELVISGNFGDTVEGVLDEAEFLGGQSYDQVIVNIGSNDVLQRLPTEESIDNLETLLSNFESADCIHLVNINEHMVDNENGESVSDEAEAFNEALTELIDADSRLSLIDWQSKVADTLNDDDPRTSTLTKDAVHPTSEGNEELRDMYASALKDC